MTFEYGIKYILLNYNAKKSDSHGPDFLIIKL